MLNIIIHIELVIYLSSILFHKLVFYIYNWWTFVSHTLKMRYSKKSILKSSGLYWIWSRSDQNYYLMILREWFVISSIILSSYTNKIWILRMQTPQTTKRHLNLTVLYKNSTRTSRVITDKDTGKCIYLHLSKESSRIFFIISEGKKFFVGF